MYAGFYLLRLFTLLVLLVIVTSQDTEVKSCEDRCKYWCVNDVWRPQNEWIRGFSYILIFITLLVALIGLVLGFTYWAKLHRKLRKIRSMYGDKVLGKGKSHKPNSRTSGQINDKEVKYPSVSDLEKNPTPRSYSALEINSYVMNYNLLYKDFWTQARFINAAPEDLDSWRGRFVKYYNSTLYKIEELTDNHDTHSINITQLRPNAVVIDLKGNAPLIQKSSGLTRNGLLINTNAKLQKSNNWIEDVPTADPGSTKAQTSVTMFSSKTLLSPTKTPISIAFSRDTLFDQRLKPINEKVSVFEEELV